ncbi:MAG: squalene/phytoene synthase family protein, partial [Candidatus Eremiobacteraeota bacterium]|nr:squalene/phytoene synthase family protein [Candidatus Eremiobacteraeota bacterium]
MKIGAPDGELAAADAYCRFLAERHYENFTVASRLIAPSLRRDLARIYAYARTTDDLGDENQREALVRLQRWRDEVVALFAGHAPIHPVLIALRETIRERRLAQQPFLDLIAANVQDQSVTSYETWPQLEAYCRLSAAPVGRMVLGVFGIDGAEAERLSDDVCIGLQLANFAQDVARDAQLGRTYLLQVDLREGGQTAATHALCKRARELLASG